MKLVDILARDMKSWPRSSDCHWARQDYDKEIRFKNSSFDFYAKELADDHGNIGDGPVVTKDEWQAAVDLLKDAENTPSEWNGEGLPPVGGYCEAKVKGGNGDWKEYRVLAATADYLIVLEGQEETPIRHNYWEFRPIRSAEQIAADKRDKAIKEMTDGYDNAQLRDWAVHIYDKLGYRKQAYE